MLREKNLGLHYIPSAVSILSNISLLTSLPLFTV